MAAVANWCSAHTGAGFSREYMRQLRFGGATNPTKRHLEAIAAFFAVSPAIFFDSEQSQQILDDLDLVGAFRRSGVLTLALRAVGLSAENRQQVLELIQSLQQQDQN